MEKCDFINILFEDLPCMVAAFPQSSRLDPNYPGWSLSMDRSWISQVAANCRAIMMSVDLDSAPNRIQDLRHRRGGMCSLGRGSHRTMTQQANFYDAQNDFFC
jgi:hypothetical protein